MTTLGFHYFPDENHYRQADLQAWLPELLALDAKWLTLTGSLTRAVPEAFIRELIEAGIEPIIHLPGVPLRADALGRQIGGLASLFKTYARWGVRFVVPFSEPNTRAVWAPADWGKPGLVPRFLDALVPVLAAQVEAGLQPVFPALRAGGDWWDTAFLEAALAGLTRRGQRDLARQLTFAVNLWSYNRPLDWGQGGLRRWPQARPYLTPPGTQDQRGFRLVDWYDEIIRARLGEARPFVCLAGGPTLGDRTDPQLPAVDEDWHTSCIEQIVQGTDTGRWSTQLLNVNFWLLAAPAGSPFAAEAWYRPDGRVLPAIAALKQLASRGQPAARRQINESAVADAHLARVAHSAPTAAPGDKALQHYMLLPVFEWGVSEWHWTAALEYVKAHRPVCGFSASEAARAQRVTIFGNEQGISPAIEADLRRAGCQVERLSAAR
jgi:hypothetical protein